MSGVRVPLRPPIQQGFCRSLSSKSLCAELRSESRLRRSRASAGWLSGGHLRLPTPTLAVVACASNTATPRKERSRCANMRNGDRSVVEPSPRRRRTTRHGEVRATPGWVNRVWVGDALVVRLSDGQLPGSFLHEAQVVGLLTETAVPHARCIGTGTSPDGMWHISERLPGRTLHQV